MGENIEHNLEKDKTPTYTMFCANRKNYRMFLETTRSKNSETFHHRIPAAASTV